MNLSIESDLTWVNESPLEFLIIPLLNSVSFFTGVPDSILKNFIDLLNKEKNFSHIISANEGLAVSLAIGNYFATDKVPLVYMQNSGLGNAINPLTSIADKKI